MDENTLLGTAVIFMLIVAIVVFIIYIVTKSDGGLRLSERTAEEKNDICKGIAQKLGIFLGVFLIAALVVFGIAYLIDHSIEYALFELGVR